MLCSDHPYEVRLYGCDAASLGFAPFMRVKGLQKTVLTSSSILLLARYLLEPDLLGV
jgi:hypothetical protein